VRSGRAAARRGGRALAGATLLLLGGTGCFATRNDVRILQGDISTVRTEAQRSAQAQAAALTETARLLQAVSDSLTRLSSRQVDFAGDTRGELRRVNEQLIQVQQLLGQSASIIRSLRADLEAAGRTVVPEPAGGAGALGGVTPPPAGAGTPPTAAPPAGAPVTAGVPRPGTPPAAGAVPPGAPSGGQLPGPNVLYQDGMDHLRRSSYASARIAFGDLLLNYPGSDVAPEAQYLIAESYAAERNLTAAETAYAAVVSKYPESPRAPEAMYKRARIFMEQGNNAAARPLLEQIIRQYPSSDVAEFAKERLATMPPEA
jgi:tol-pal system protein YbgF